MKINSYLTAGVSVLAFAAIGLLATGAAANPIYYPYRLGATPIDPNRPLHHVGPYLPPYVDKNPKTKSGTWTDVSGKLPFTGDGPWVAEQLTDGTALVQNGMSGQWYKLTPDSKGQYTDGTWSAIATMPSGYAPLFMATQVLSDGRVIVNGGEYNNGQGDHTNLGALYDPVANKWVSVTAPSGFSTIGDAQSVVLPDGNYMLADCCSNGQAIATISGNNVTWTATGGAKYYNNEEAWTPLPGGDLLTVDVWNLPNSVDDYEIYDTASGTWSLAGNHPESADHNAVPRAWACSPYPERSGGRQHTPIRRQSE